MSIMLHVFFKVQERIIEVQTGPVEEFVEVTVLIQKIYPLSLLVLILLFLLLVYGFDFNLNLPLYWYRYNV